MVTVFELFDGSGSIPSKVTAPVVETVPIAVGVTLMVILDEPFAARLPRLQTTVPPNWPAAAVPRPANY